jgi:hypothetical protein
MGRINGPYNEEYPAGTLVHIMNRAELEEFCKGWRWHHPLQEEQLAFADQSAVVAAVAFYHGGDELFRLNGVLSIWHEECLRKLPEDD